MKLSPEILDDYKIATLPDDQWRKRVEAIIFNPDNFYYEDVSARYSWQLVSKKTRPEVLARDGNICRQCGSTQNLEVDHIIPLARGGSNELDNLQVLCRTCNRKKWIY